MRIDDQINVDFDWWALDKAGHVGHFKTAGRATLPESVACNDEDHAVIWDYFIKRAPAIGSGVLPSDVVHRITLTWDATIENALGAWREMAARGCYSYDLSERSDEWYELIVMPTRPTTILELPVEIQQIVSRTVLRDVEFSRTERIASATTLLA